MEIEKEVKKVSLFPDQMRKSFKELKWKRSRDNPHFTALKSVFFLKEVFSFCGLGNDPSHVATP